MPGPSIPPTIPPGGGGGGGGGNSLLSRDIGEESFQQLLTRLHFQSGYGITMPVRAYDSRGEQVHFGDGNGDSLTLSFSTTYTSMKDLIEAASGIGLDKFTAKDGGFGARTVGPISVVSNADVNWRYHDPDSPVSYTSPSRRLGYGDIIQLGRPLDWVPVVAIPIWQYAFRTQANTIFKVAVMDQYNFCVGEGTTGTIAAGTNKIVSDLITNAGLTFGALEPVTVVITPDVDVYWNNSAFPGGYIISNPGGARTITAGTEFLAGDTIYPWDKLR